MGKNLIKLGYELGTGKQIDIEPSHLIVTGLSQKAGKTSTLEALIKRSGNNGTHFPRLKDGITEMMGTHKATDIEIENTYQHILMELLG